MNIIRRVKTRDFTIIGNKVLRDKGLSFKAKGLLAYLLSHKDGWYVSLKKITLSSLEGVDAIRSGLNELVRGGYVKRREIHNKSGKFDVEFLISEFPEDLTVLDYPTRLNRHGKTDTVNPMRSSLYRENQIKKTSGKKSSSVRKALGVYGINEDMIRNVEDVIDDDDDIRFFFDMIKRIDDEVKAGKVKRVVPYVLKALGNFIIEIESEGYLKEKAGKQAERKREEAAAVAAAVAETQAEKCQKFYDSLREADKEVLIDEAIENSGKDFIEKYGMFMVEGKFNFDKLPDSGKNIVIGKRNEIIENSENFGKT